MDTKENVKKWLDRFCDFKAIDWALLPDIDLYMDQVTNYLRRQLFLQEKDSENPIITSNMVNNYAKGGHIERANQKRYNKEQLATLYMLCSIKRSLSINDSSLLLSSLKENSSTEELYSKFINMQSDIFSNFKSCLSLCEKDCKDELLQAALSLALNSVAEQLVAEKILSMFYPEEDEEAKKDKEKDKKDEKKKKSKKEGKKEEN